MTERVTKRGIRQYRTRAEAEQLVRDFEGSGLLRREFCEKNRVALHTFNRYVRQYGVQGPAGAEVQRLVPVEIVNAEARAELVVLLAKGRRVEVARGFDPATLLAVVKTLETH